MANVKKRGRGRPRKIDIHQNVKVDVKLVKMKDVEFDDRLFVPMKTKTIVDSVLSNEGGIFLVRTPLYVVIQEWVNQQYY